MHCISHLSCDGHLPRQEVDKMKRTENENDSKSIPAICALQTHFYKYGVTRIYSITENIKRRIKKEIFRKLKHLNYCTNNNTQCTTNIYTNICTKKITDQLEVKHFYPAPSCENFNSTTGMWEAIFPTERIAVVTLPVPVWCMCTVLAT